MGVGRQELGTGMQRCVGSSSRVWPSRRLDGATKWCVQRVGMVPTPATTTTATTSHTTAQHFTIPYCIENTHTANSVHMSTRPAIYPRPPDLQTQAANAYPFPPRTQLTAMHTPTHISHESEFLQARGVAVSQSVRVTHRQLHLSISVSASHTHKTRPPR